MNTKLKKSTILSSLLKFGAYFSAMLVLFCLADVACAAEHQNLGKIAFNVMKSMGSLGKLIVAVSYVAGVSFALMGMLKFKAHKDNPAQVPLSQPLVLLAISAGLVYLPSLISTGGHTLWKEDQISGSTSGFGLLGIKN